MTLFGLLRHGFTQWNEEKRIQGRRDSPLSPRGKEQIATWGAALETGGWDRIIASDLGRVKETVAILNRVLHLPVIFDPRLREIDWGTWEGMKVADVKENHGDELDRQVQAGWHFRAPGGESRLEVLNRVKECLHHHGTRYGGENILTVCHLGVIKCLLYDCLKRQFLPVEKNVVKKECLHCIWFKNNGFSIKEMNIEPPGRV